MCTPGVEASPHRTELFEAIKRYDFSQADPGNDPYSERDFGVIDLDGIRYFWKIDYYDRKLKMHSPNEADPSVTTRVLTAMLAEEY